MLILPDSPTEATLARAEALRQGSQQVMLQHRGEWVGPLEMSLGAASFPEHGRSANALLRAADIALYQAKALGRNRVELATSAGHVQEL